VAAHAGLRLVCARVSSTRPEGCAEVSSAKRAGEGSPGPEGNRGRGGPALTQRVGPRPRTRRRQNPPVHGEKHHQAKDSPRRHPSRPGPALPPIVLQVWPAASRAPTVLRTSPRLQSDGASREGALRQALLPVTYARQGEIQHACKIAGAPEHCLPETLTQTGASDIRRVQEALSRTGKSARSATSTSA